MSEVTAPPITITDFLNARLDERERLARLSNILVTDFWPDEDKTFNWQLEIRESPGGTVVSTSSLTGAPSPAEVLADIAAKRAVAGEHRLSDDPEGWRDCSQCGEVGRVADNPGCWTLCQLASVYAAHPDYRQEWAV